MNDWPASEPSGWNFARAAGLVVGIVAMAGFGFCSLCGLVLGVATPDLLLTVLVFAVPGLALAAGGFWLAHKMLRLARGRRS